MKNKIIILCISLITCNITFCVDQPQLSHQDYLKYRSNPQIKAFLDTISYAEGTLHENGYNARYPGLYFNSFQDHPRIRSCAPFKGGELCATAAGRYMILARTLGQNCPDY